MPTHEPAVTGRRAVGARVVAEETINDHPSRVCLWALRISGSRERLALETVHYLRIISRQWWLVLITVVAGAAGGMLVYYYTTPLYQSSVQLIVSGSAAARDVASKQAVALSQIAGTPPAIADATLAAGYPSATPDVTATATGTSPFFTILVVEESPAVAQAVANAYLKSLVGTAVRLEGDGPSPVAIAVVSPAVLPVAPFTPNPKRDIGFGIAAGLVLGIAIALLRDSLNQRIRDTEELERLSGLIVLGTVLRDAPEMMLPVSSDPRGLRAEAYRQIRTSVANSAGSRPLILAVTSASAGEGKTSVTTNVAAAFSRAGHRVAVVDADLRRPCVGDFFGLENTLGLTDVLSGEKTLNDALVILDDGRLAVLPSGRIPANPSEALGGVRMEQLLRQLAKDYEYVFIDTPPVLPVTDALVLAPKVTGVILVVRLGRTTRDQLKRAMSAIARVDADILGAVPNQADKRADGEYRYRYRYYYSQTQKGDAAKVEIAPEALHASNEDAASAPTSEEPRRPAESQKGSWGGHRRMSRVRPSEPSEESDAEMA